MKIGILTFHCARNYGAVLQAYATQKYLKNLGHKVDLIDYRPAYLVNAYHLIPTSFVEGSSFEYKIKSILVSLSIFPLNYLKYKKFEKFISSKLSLSKKIEKRDDFLNLDYEAYIMGSDQIWNPFLTKGFDDIFFGNFPTRNNPLKITYAASMGLAELTKEQENYLQENLKYFNKIGVRENNLKMLLTPLTEKKIEEVIDPTFLLSQSEWNLLISENNAIKHKKYVLIYQVVFDPNVYRIAKGIADQLNIEVIEIVAGNSLKKIRGNNQYYASPNDFVSYFNYATCVVTSSFHGTAFGVIFNKPLYVVNVDNLKGGSNSRLSSFLSKLGLMNRYVDADANPKFETIDYTEINQKMDLLKEEAQHFLIHSLD